MSLVNVSLVGNLVKKPEQVLFDSGKVKTTLVVATNSFDSRTETKVADFYRVETWGRLAELASRYLDKGSQVTVSGRLILDRWTDTSGNRRITPTVKASQLALPPKPRYLDRGEATAELSSTDTDLQEHPECLEADAVSLQAAAAPLALGSS